jgi:ketosteroid isomerase-like protein
MPPMDVNRLRDLFELHNATGRDFPDILAAHLHPDSEFLEFAASPSAATYRGPAAIAGLFRNRFEAGSMFISDLNITAVDDRRALAAFDVQIHGAASGAESSMRMWNLFTFEGDRILRIEEFSDESEALTSAARASDG